MPRRRSSPASEPPPAPSGEGATPQKRRKAYAALTGSPKGLVPKLGAQPLRCILVGHNPSEHAWHTGHFYSNPSNRMWPILIKTGIAPPGTTGPEADDSMPASVGVGFIDVGTGAPGTDSSLFSAADFSRWRGAFYQRLAEHMQAASASIGCRCGRHCGAPTVVAFTGKRQFLELLHMDAAGQPLGKSQKVPGAAVPYGRQPAHQLPASWPLPDSTEVWVLTSTSGAAPMSNADRERPYQQLAERLKQIPLARVAACAAHE